jgi:hypothetical protein
VQARRRCLPGGAARSQPGARNRALPFRRPTAAAPAPYHHRRRAQRREHGDFLLRLSDVMPGRRQLLDGIEAAAAARGLRLEPAEETEAREALRGSYLRQNRLVDVAAALEERQAAAAAAEAAAAAGA